MGCYSRNLLTVDLTDSYQQVAAKAVRFPQQFNGQLHIVHVVEPQSLAYGDEVPIDVTPLHETFTEQAAAYLREFS